MSKEAYTRFVNILNDIANQKSPELAELFKKGTKVVSDLTEAYKKQNEAFVNYRKIDSIYVQFEKLCKAYKNIN